MSEWITDRGPTNGDTSRNLDFHVWTIHNNEVVMWYFGDIEYGEPWMPIEPPEPYVKPKKRFKVFASNKYYAVYNVVGSAYCIADEIHSEEAAERIAAIYEEVLP